MEFYKDKKLMLIPIILSVLIALYVTLSINGPLSWDIYTHINYAWAYLLNGITLTDNLLNAPTGKSIGYAPLFHFLLIIVSKITGTSFIVTAQILQIVFVLVTVGLIVYVSYKVFGTTSAIFSGLLLISSYMLTRLLMPIPETFSIIFFILGVYFHYISIEEEKVIYAFYSAIMALLIIGTHPLTFVYYGILISTLSLIYLILSRKLSIIKSYITWIIPLIIVFFLGFIFVKAISPEKASILLNTAISIIYNPLSLFMGQKAMGLERYIWCVGILPLTFGIVGIYYSIKNREHYFIAVWALLSFIISNLHWFGIPVYTYRLLIYLIIPAVIIGGYGVSQLIERFDLKSNQKYVIVLCAFVILSLFCAITSFSDESAIYSSVSVNNSTVHIAPPTDEEMEVINWFKTQNDTNSSVLTNNLFFGMVLSSSDVIPIHYSFDVYASPSSRKSSSYELNNESIGYIVYDKSLVLNNSSEYGTPEIVFVEADYYPLYYYTHPINEDNFNKIKLSSTTKEFENERFIICKVI